jgi:hypothetical protein
MSDVPMISLLSDDELDAVTGGGLSVRQNARGGNSVAIARRGGDAEAEAGDFGSADATGGIGGFAESGPGGAGGTNTINRRLGQLHQFPPGRPLPGGATQVRLASLERSRTKWSHGSAVATSAVPPGSNSVSIA